MKPNPLLDGKASTFGRSLELAIKERVHKKHWKSVSEIVRVMGEKTVMGQITQAEPADRETLALKLLRSPEAKEIVIAIENKAGISLPCEEIMTRATELYQKPLPPVSSLSNLPPPTTTYSNLTPEEDKERNAIIARILSTERPIIAQLKAGIHKEVLYFGTVICDPREGYIPRQAVVTSDKRIFVNWGNKRANEIRDDFKLHYRQDFEHEALDAHWSNDSILSWLYQDLPTKTLAEQYEQIRSINEKYMYYPDKKVHKIIALDIISTYFLPIFEAKGRTFLEAEKGSGKTRQCTIYRLLSSNPIMSSDVTKAAFFRITESTCSTLIVDDFDDLHEDQKRDVLQHYKTGYKNSGKSIRTGEGPNRKIESFRNYGHVVMNNTSGLDPISADRSIFIPMLKTDSDITKKALKEKDPQWKEIRDSLHGTVLTEWKTVQNECETVTSKLRGRQFELSRPLLAIASAINKNLLAEVEKWLLTRFKERDTPDPDDWSYIALMYFKDKAERENVPLKEIAMEIVSQTNEVGDRDYKKKVRGVCVWLGKHYNALSSIFEKVMPQGSVHVRIKDRSTYERYLRTKGWEKVVEGGGTKEEPIVTTVDMRTEDSLTLEELELILSEANGPLEIASLVEKHGPGVEATIEILKTKGAAFEPRSGFLKAM